MATRSNQVVIAISTTTSAAYDLGILGGETEIIGFVMPAAFTGASISFQVSADDSTYQALYDSSNSLVSITVTAAQTYSLKADQRAVLGRWRFIKIVSASTELAARTIVVLTG